MYQFNSEEELRQFIAENVMTTSDVLEYLDISRAGLKYLIDEGKITPFKDQRAIRLFFRSDIEGFRQKE